MEVLFGPKGSDIVFADYGRCWEVLRRVMHSAVRKYAVSEPLPVLVADVVDEAMMLIKDKHKSEPFDPREYIHLIVYNILAQSAFGKK